MSDKSKIEWTDATWNPVTGCEKVSQGCKHCYAERQWPRFHGREWVDVPLKGPIAKIYPEIPTVNIQRPFTHVMCHPERLDQPLRWKQPRRIFVNSISDLFHDDVPDEFIARIFGAMAATQHHTFQVLTKRPERMRNFLVNCAWWEGWVTHNGSPVEKAYQGNGIIVGSRQTGWPLPNVWLGVSVEDQSTADERIPLLLQTPAAVRWVSAEPLLGEISLERFLLSSYDKAAHDYQMLGTECRSNKLNWIVAGGESGPKARPMHPDWIRSLRDQCDERGTPFLFKQWGEWVPGLDASNEQIDAARSGAWVHLAGGIHDGNDKDVFLKGDGHVLRVGKKSAGRLLDGVLHDDYPSARE